MCLWTNGSCIRKTGCLLLLFWRTAVISGSSLLQVLIPAHQWSTYTQVCLEIAFFSTHKLSVDFPSKSVGSGASLQDDSLVFMIKAEIESWNSKGQVRFSIFDSWNYKFCAQGGQVLQGIRDPSSPSPKAKTPNWEPGGLQAERGYGECAHFLHIKPCCDFFTVSWGHITPVLYEFFVCSQSGDHP